MPVRIQFRRGTASEWTSANPTLSAGEMGLETDTLKFKIGDGTTAWTSLAYATQGEGVPVGGTTGQVLAKASNTSLDTEWIDAGAGDMAKATYDPTNVNGDAFDTDNHVDGTTNKVYTATEKTKLAGIEASADVTDTANVTSAGALMDSEVDADIKTLSLPANTTISAFGKTLVDDADAGTARATLGTLQADGPAKLTVSATEPTSPSTNDLWVDTA
jgi:hypothetical protein